MAETSGTAASRSTAAGAREVLRRPAATAARAASHRRSISTSRSSAAPASAATARRKLRNPERRIPGLVGPERGRPGDRQRGAEHAHRAPAPHQGRAQRRARPAALEPEPGAPGGIEQRDAVGALPFERGQGHQDLVLRVAVGRGEPAVVVEGEARGVLQRARVPHPLTVPHGPQRQAFQRGGEMPGIDQVSVRRGLAPGRVEPGPVQQGRQQGMQGGGRVEPRERRAGRGKRRQQGRVSQGWGRVRPFARQQRHRWLPSPAIQH